MELKDKVCTFEQSKRLDELGFVMETQYSWVFHKNNINLIHTKVAKAPGPGKFNIVYLAPDVAELGGLLPESILILKEEYWLYMMPNRGNVKYPFNISYRDSTGHAFHKYAWSEKTEANARCAALIFLIKNGHINHNKQ